MPSGFFKCQEGIDAYKTVGKPYDDTLDDIRYENILKITRNSPHSSKNKKIVRVMVRLVADDGQEYIKYDLYELLYDAIGAWHEVYQSNVGLYPIPVTQPKMEYGPGGQVQEVVNGPIVRIDTGYSIPFTKEAADDIHKMCNDISQRDRTQYLAKLGNGKRITCKNYAVFRDWTLEEIETGKINDNAKLEKGKTEKVAAK
jgi:hypothetical protein